MSDSEWLWVTLSVDLTVPWDIPDIPGHSNLVQLLVQSNPIPVQPPRETSLERTERTERTTGRHRPQAATGRQGPPGLCRLWWKAGRCCLLNPAVRCLSELFELSDHMQHEKLSDLVFSVKISHNGIFRNTNLSETHHLALSKLSWIWNQHLIKKTIVSVSLTSPITWNCTLVSHSCPSWNLRPARAKGTLSTRWSWLICSWNFYEFLLKSWIW